MSEPTKGPMTVGYDGPSRPIILTPTAMLSISKFEGGRWTSYNEEDADCHVFSAATNSLEVLKFVKKEWQHNFPSDCYSNGPHSGDPIQDYVVCPGCVVQAKIDAAIAKAETV